MRWVGIVNKQTNKQISLVSVPGKIYNFDWKDTRGNNELNLRYLMWLYAKKEIYRSHFWSLANNWEIKFIAHFVILKKNMIKWIGLIYRTLRTAVSWLLNMVIIKYKACMRINKWFDIEQELDYDVWDHLGYLISLCKNV